MAEARPDPDTPVTIISRVLSACFASERFVSEGFTCACFALERRNECFVGTPLRFIGWRPQTAEWLRRRSASRGHGQASFVAENVESLNSDCPRRRSADRF